MQYNMQMSPQSLPIFHFVLITALLSLLSTPQNDAIPTSVVGEIISENLTDFENYNSNLESIQISNSTLHSKICESNPTGSYTDLICIPKCCPAGQVLDYGGASYHIQAHTMQHAEPRCVHSGGIDWSPSDLILTDSQENDGIIYNDSIKLRENVAVFHNKLMCSPGLLYLIHENAFFDKELLELGPDQNIDRFHIFPNGTIHSESGLIFSDDICLDGIQNFVGGEIQSNYSGQHAAHVVLGVCLPEGVYDPGPPTQLGDDDDKVHFLIYWVVLPFASLFLLGTILIYLLIWSTHNIHGYTLFSYVVSLFGNYVVLFISQVGVVKYETPVCAFVGVCTHFFFLMTAAWLTVVNFDVFHTFKHLKAGRPSKNLGRYMAYFVFAVGTPVLIVFSSGLLDNAYKNDSFATSPIILPNYQRSCVLSPQSVAFYLYAPLGILVCANLVFFFATIFLLVSYQRSIGAVLKGTCTTKEDQSLRLFLKLFVVMGFSWTFEVIGWAVEKSLGDDLTGISTAVAIVDVFNLLLAIPIFFIFVWKKAIFDQLWIQYPTILQKPLRILVFCGCVDSTPDDKRPSLSAMTMSLPRNGTFTRSGTSNNNSGQGQGRMSSGSVSELIASRNRKRSNDSQGSESCRKASVPTISEVRETGGGGGDGMTVVVEESEIPGEVLTSDLDDKTGSSNVKVSHHPNDTEPPCPEI